DFKEKRFVVPPSGGRKLTDESIGHHRTLPPEGGTTNKAWSEHRRENYGTRSQQQRDHSKQAEHLALFRRAAAHRLGHTDRRLRLGRLAIRTCPSARTR